MKTCGQCGTVNSSDAITCENCGEILSVISDAPSSEHETEQSAPPSVQPAEDTLPAEAETPQAPPASPSVTSDTAAPHTKGVGKKAYIIVC